MSDFSDYHNKYIQLEGSDTKYYITEFDLEAKLTARIAELEGALQNVKARWSNLKGDWEETASDMYDIAQEVLK